MHEEFLRGLAQHLASDVFSAEELVQETWTYALEHPPHHRRNLRGWLRVVTRHLLPRTRALASPRHDVDRVRDGEERSTDQVASRREFLEGLVLEVQRLPEPYRGVLLMRHFDGLTPSEIASALERPLNTVNAQLRRGLAVLRERMDMRSRLERPLWCATLLAALPQGPGSPRSSVPDPHRERFVRTSTLVRGTLAASLVIAILAVFAVGAGRSRSDVPASAHTVEIPGPATANHVEIAPPAIAFAPELRATVAPESVTAPEPETPSKTQAIHGRVQDLQGRELEGLEVVFEPGQPRSGWDGENLFDADVVDGERDEWTTISGASGRFALEVDPALQGRLFARGRGYVSVVTELESLNDRADHERTLIVAPERALSGRVVGSDGVALAGARIVLRADFLPTERVRNPLMQTPFAHSDANGNFSIDEAYEAERAVLMVRYGDIGTTVRLEENESTVLVRMDRPASEDHIRVRIVDRHGATAYQALLAVDGSCLVASVPGAYAIPIGDLDGDVVAASPGSLPTTWIPPASVEPGGVHEIVLGEDTLAISGRVVDSDGAPVTGCRVWVTDPTAFAIEPRPMFVEAILSDEGEYFSPSAETDEDGRFLIGGLLDRDYTLKAVLKRSLTLASSGPVRAGAGGSVEVVLHLPTSATRTRLEGRVVSATGLPVVGARVVATKNLVRSGFPWREGPFELGVDSRAAITDPEGRFVLPALDLDGASIRVTGAHVFVSWIDADDLLPPAETDVLVSLRAAIHVEAPDDCPADAFGVFDASGDLLTMIPRQVGMVHRAAGIVTRAFLEGEGTRTWDVPETAVEMALFADGEIVHRFGIAPVPGSVTGIRVPGFW